MKMTITFQGSVFSWIWSEILITGVVVSSPLFETDPALHNEGLHEHAVITPTSLVSLGKVGSKTFYAETNRSYNQTQAVAYCRNVGMTLALLETKAEMNLLNNSYATTFSSWHHIAGSNFDSFKVEKPFNPEDATCPYYRSLPGTSVVETNWPCSHLEKVLCQKIDPVTTTTPAPSTTTTLQPGDTCDPKWCRNNGTCITFNTCSSDGFVVTRECPERQFWEPLEDDCENLRSDGGECVNKEQLCPETLERYENDPDCLECGWRAVGECQREYNYLPPMAQHPNDIEKITCREGNVFDLEEKLCRPCHLVQNRETGDKCC